MSTEGGGVTERVEVDFESSSDAVDFSVRWGSTSAMLRRQAAERSHHQPIRRGRFR